MKLTKIMSMMAAATAVGFCMSASATGEGRSGKLELDNPVTKVNVTTSSATGGSWNNPAPATENSYFVIDCDAATSNQFTATEAGITTGKVVKCTFTLQAAPVPMPLSIPDGNTQVAFCIATNTTLGGAASFQAYVNQTWTALTGVAIPATETEYTLTITFDYSESTKYAKFTIGNTDLAASGVSWLQTSKSSDSVSQYCFIGEGNLKSFLTTDQNIAAEDINITPPGGGAATEIAVPEELVAGLRAGGVAAADMGTTLSGAAANGATVLENYVLFGITNTNAVTAATKPEAKIATAKVDGNIPLDFQNLNVKSVDGVTPSYQLKGQKSSSGAWYTLATANDAAALKITPAYISDGYRNFKVVVSFTY